MNVVIRAEMGEYVIAMSAATKHARSFGDRMRDGSEEE